MSPALAPLRAHATSAAVAAAVLSSTGCELVFGLDDYAQATSEATTTSTSTGGDGGSGTGGPTGSGGDTSSTSKGGGGPSSSSKSSSSGDGGGCPCVPEGWKLFEAHPVAQDAEPTICDSDVAATRALQDPVVGCECSCSVVDGLDCTMTCWDQQNCSAGNVQVLPSAVCAGMIPALSCTISKVLNGGLATESCAASGTVSLSAPNAFDLCTGPSDTTACGEDGVCTDPPDGMWCIQGPAGEACPADWPDARNVEVGGTPSCDCQCVDNLTCDGTWGVSNGDLCLSDVRSVGPECANLTGQAKYTGGPPIDGSDALGGDCSPVAINPPGELAGGAASALCCRPF